MLKKLRNKWAISGIAALLLVLIAGVVVAQTNVASLASLNHYLVPNKLGAGVQVDCGGDHPGIRGILPVCTSAQTGNSVTVTQSNSGRFRR